MSSSTTRSPSDRMYPREMLSSWSGSTWNIRSTRPVVATAKGTYHYTDLTFVRDVCDMRVGGHEKPFHPS